MSDDEFAMRKKPRYPFLLLTLPSVVVVVVVVALMNWRIPTRVQVELTADRAMFTVGGTDTAQILNTVGCHNYIINFFIIKDIICLMMCSVALELHLVPWTLQGNRDDQQVGCWSLAVDGRRCPP